MISLLRDEGDDSRQNNITDNTVEMDAESAAMWAELDSYDREAALV